MWSAHPILIAAKSRESTSRVDAKATDLALILSGNRSAWYTRSMFLWISAALGAMGVGLGAFGAHALRGRLAPEKLDAWNTAVNYHLLHCIALLALALWAHATGARIALTGWLLTAGIVLFAGSIYALVLTKMSVFGPITPIGGVLLIAAWVSLLWLRL